MKKGKRHMDISMRSRIEFALAAGHSIRTIARDIGVSLSTVSREIRKHTYESFKGCYGRTNQCIHRADCRLSGVYGSSSLPKSKQVSQFITSVSQMPRCSHETPPLNAPSFIYETILPPRRDGIDTEPCVFTGIAV